jgi:hypothetical protein
MTATIVPKLQREEPSTQLLLVATPCGLPQESTVTLSHQHACCEIRREFLGGEKKMVFKI